jgi:hypothetical protein
LGERRNAICCEQHEEEHRGWEEFHGFRVPKMKRRRQRGRKE